MSAYRSLLESWSRYVNEQDLAAGAQACAEAVCLITYPQGVGGDQTVMQGRAVVDEWVQRLDPSRYRLDVDWEGLKAVEVEARLPACDALVSVPYAVRILDYGWEDWSNPGLWTFALRDGKIIGVIHEPRPIEDEANDYVEKTVSTNVQFGNTGKIQLGGSGNGDA